jgi:Mg/Co/Ni transporter MgtE
MGSLESLNAQQRAVVQLLLRQGKSYDEIAALLHSDAAAIRRRAHGAVGALAPDDADVPADRRNEIADYLLGQQTASQRAATREYLEGSAAGRGWARAAAGALASVGGAEKLPDVPAEPQEVAEAFDALDARTARQEEVKRSAKRGNALISAGLGLVLAIVIIVVVALISSGGDDNSGTDNAAATTTTPPAATTTRRSSRRASCNRLRAAARRPAARSRSCCFPTAAPTASR